MVWIGEQAKDLKFYRSAEQNENSQLQVKFRKCFLGHFESIAPKNLHQSLSSEEDITICVSLRKHKSNREYYIS